MGTLHDKMRARLLDAVGVDDTEVGKLRNVSAAWLLGSQVSKEYREHMDRRMIMGAFRYGLVQDQARPGAVRYDNIGSVKKRLDLYLKTGNLEHLVDAGNIVMVEYVTSQHPLKHFESVDDGVHTERI